MPEPNGGSVPDLEKLVAPVPTSDPKAEAKAMAEAAFAEEMQRAQLDDFKNQVKQRKLFAWWLFGLVCVWLVATFGVVLLQGFKGTPYGFFELTDGVLLALIGATTANVLAMFVIVINFLFPKRNSTN